MLYITVILTQMHIPVKKDTRIGQASAGSDIGIITK